MIYKIKQNIERFPQNTAFVIEEKTYTYADFGQKISDIRSRIEQLSPDKNEVIGVVTSNDIETYATIYALWFSGLCFLPINPLLPVARNHAIIELTEIRYILTSKTDAEILSVAKNIQPVSTHDLSKATLNLEIEDTADDDVMYILFTSGSTGIPKGVPINRRNLNGFVDGFYANGYQIDENDRFLQMFDFTFDISVQCYVLPLCVGASVHTIPLDNVKFFAIYQILDKHKITVAKMVPSVIAFLRPYFPKIHLPELRYSLFSGEALFDEIVAEWSKCVPNAVIQNYYGPTEATIDCTYYTWQPTLRETKTYNGVVSIGKPFGDSKAIILGENDRLITATEKGELCITGNQVTTGYIKLEERNRQAFVDLNGERYYRTGDLVFRDEDGDYLYCGRIDHQVQVQGYRVELGELEHHSKQIAGNIQAAAIAKENTNGNTQIFLFLETKSTDTQLIEEHLSQVLPYYMQPTKIITLESFPLTTSGKTDRNRLKSLI